MCTLHLLLAIIVLMRSVLRSEDLSKNNVREFRKAQKLTQEELANMVGVTRQTIISIEKNKYTPSLPLALKLANVCNVKVEDLFSL